MFRSQSEVELEILHIYEKVYRGLPGFVKLFRLL